MTEKTGMQSGDSGSPAELYSGMLFPDFTGDRDRRFFFTAAQQHVKSGFAEILTVALQVYRCVIEGRAVTALFAVADEKNIFRTVQIVFKHITQHPGVCRFRHDDAVRRKRCSGKRGVSILVRMSRKMKPAAVF